MSYNFCTLFDKNYIYRGLALYYSLVANCPQFKLWILCMDDVLFEQLKKMSLSSVELIRLADFEAGDEKLLAVKSTRTVGEYCWTISSSLPLYIFNLYPNLEHVVYLDSDLYFFSSPEVIFHEIGDASIAIVRHNYSKELSYLEKKSGIYNVSWVFIRNDDNGVKCLTWWRERCLEWCYAYFENGKLGDQMYLDDWPERFKGVRVIKNKGVNLAPWNLNKYYLTQKDGKIYVDEDPLVFYHFHSFKMFGQGEFQLYYSSYLICRRDRGIIYSPYINFISGLAGKIKKDYPDFKHNFDQKPAFNQRLKIFLKKKLSFWFYYQSLKNL